MSDAAPVLAQLPILDADDYKQLITALLKGENRGLSTGELQAFCDYCDLQLAGAVLVGLLLRGDIKAKWSTKEDDWVFHT